MVEQSSPVKKPGTAFSIFGICTVLLAPLLFGLVIGSTGPSIDTMKNGVRDKDGNPLRLTTPNRYVVFDEREAAIYSSLVNVGAMAGALGSGYLARSLGYRNTILMTIPMYATSFVAMYIVEQAWGLFVARTLLGIAIGINSFTAPTYIGDLSPINLRGFFGAANQLCITIGILAVYFLGSHFRVKTNTMYQPPEGTPLGEIVHGAVAAFDNSVLSNPFCDWRALALSNLFLVVILGVLTFFIPESPSWLASSQTSDPSKTKRSVIHKRATDEPSRLSGFRGVKKQLAVAITLQFFQQFSGINAIMFFCTSIMRNAKVEHADRYASTVMLEQVIVTAIAAALMDVAGRKVLLLVGASVMAASCGVLGLYFLLMQMEINGIIIMLLAGMYAYIAAFSIGVGAIPWLILGEIFPADRREMGASIASTANWLFAFIVTLCYQPVANALSVQIVMWFFGICCLGLVVFAAIAVPETKGKTFDEIQAFFYQPVDNVVVSTETEVPGNVNETLLDDPDTEPVGDSAANSDDNSPENENEPLLEFRKVEERVLSV